MEDVAMMPPSTTNDADISEDESESISLDLHVSDTDESIPESGKKDTMLESEDDILNKFVDVEEETFKDKLVNGHPDNGNETEDTPKEINKDNEETLTNGNSKQEEEQKSECKETTIKEKVDSTQPEKTQLVNGEKSKENSEQQEQLIETNEELPTENKEEPAKEEKVKENSVTKAGPSKCETGKKTGKSEDENQDEEDLLQVMETSFVDEADKDENSCSSSEKDENGKDEESEEIPPKDENAEVTTKENKEGEDHTKEDDGQDVENNVEDQETECQDKDGDDQNKDGDENGVMVNEAQADNLEGCENDESHDVDTHECPMDIEENNIGGVIITEHDKSLEEEEEGEKEENDKTEITPAIAEETPTTVVNGTVGEDIVSLIEDDIVDEETKKSAKRPRSDDAPADDSKKIRLELPAKTKPPQTLTSFKQYMRSKGLKILTRSELEELCLQKICECLVDKSEVADLRQKVRILEQAIDNFRKEAVTVANQTRDLKIVHEKVTAALKVAKEQKGKHLVPVKITRSVGLQAVLEHPNRRHSLQNSVVQNGRTISTNNNNNNNNNSNHSNNNISSANNNVVKPGFSVVNSNIVNNNNTPKSPPVKPSPQMPVKTQTQQRTTVQVSNKQITQKENRTLPPQRSSPAQQSNNPPRKSTEHPKAVIDLTDEDDKTSSPSNRINNRVNNNIRANGQNSKTPPTIVTTSNSTPKLMMIPSTVLTTRPVMLKVNSNVVSQANGITIPPTSQVSIVATTQSVTPKTAQQIRISTTNVTSTNSTPVRKFRHPAPLPPPPPTQHQITTQRPIPPRPHLNLTKSPCGTGIVLQWKMPYQLDLYEAIVSYQLYAYQETKNPPRTDSWGKIGDVKALELPMAVTLTQFAVGNRYFFAVRAVDVHKRLGPFSEPQTILL